VDTRRPTEVEQAERRKALVVAMKNKQMTFEDIGAALDPPVSKQRAHQIYWEAVKEIVPPEVEALRSHLWEQYNSLIGETRKLFDSEHVVVSHGRIVRDDSGVPLADTAPKFTAIARIESLLGEIGKLYGAPAPAKTEVTGQELRVTIVGTNTEAMQ
jgi:hypothetical protein